MSDADWPAPEPRAPREPAQRSSPLPRVEDLPIADQGYDRESVREAFDAFYRHAAQLDATLRTLESVEVFQRTAAELRAELRTIRGSGWTVQSWQGRSYATRPDASEWTLPPSFPRVAAEAIFLIVVGVVVGVAGWSRLTIVAVMGAALAVVWMIEWVAARERAIPRAAAPAAVPALDEEPAELPAAEAVAVAEEGPEALTILGAPPVVVQDEAAPAEPEPEPEPEPEAPEPAAEPIQPELPEEPVVEDTFEEPADVAEELEPERRRFRLFRRPVSGDNHEPEVEAASFPIGDTHHPIAAAELSAQIAGSAAEVADEDVTDENVSVTVPEDPGERVAALDPWEQEAALPVEPEVPLPEQEEPEPFVQPEPEPLVEPAPEPFTEPAPEEPFVEPETPSPFVEPDQPGTFEQPETPPFWQPPEGEAEEPADDAAAEEPEPEDLPVEALADQAAAALERSRARRRAPRRARRR